jgi:hypothetical protein
LRNVTFKDEAYDKGTARRSALALLCYMPECSLLLAAVSKSGVPYGFTALVADHPPHLYGGKYSKPGI